MSSPILQLKLIRSEEDSSKGVKNVAKGECSNWAAFQILKRCLDSEGDLTWIDAAQQLYEMMPASDLKESQYSAKTQNLAHLIIEVSRITPYSHPSQDKLLKIVQHLMTSDRFVGTADLRVPYDGPLGATKVGQVYHYYWDAPREEHGFKAHHYINFHAFLARFVAWEASAGEGWLSWPLTTLESQLELPLEDRADALDTMTTSAPLFLLYADQWLFGRVVLFSPASLEDSDTAGLSGDEIYSGPSYGLERWRYWRQTLKARAEDNQLGDEARRLALKAVDFMECLERNDPRLEGRE
ncbi:DUF3632 domain-containing protein [Aspergillus stella-maris]|uniref:DUF3632 domain-containing protein n=1 Tax=Aspergillus stella-maris TaxID=1810926 RepID=UPI003CCDEC9A